MLGARLGQLWTAFGGHSADVSGSLGESLVSVEVSLERLEAFGRHLKQVSRSLGESQRV